jgi:lipid-A-disaccharide synthase
MAAERVSETLRLGLVAGEASGDLLAGMLLDGVRQRWPHFQAQGIGGPAMVQRGFETWWPQEKLAVRGYVEVLPRLPELLRIRRQLGERWLAQKPDVFIGVDAPDFNLDLEIRLRQAGVPTVHYVSPSFWAWRANKVEKLKAAADHVLCLFPFEPELLHKRGVAATFVGHPLANLIPLVPDQVAARQLLGLPQQARVVALLPGSRQAEIDHLAERFLAAAQRLQARQEDLHFVVPTLPHLKNALLAAAHRQGIALGQDPRWRLLEGQSHAALAACDLTLIASGTATLEAALFKRPMVIAYHMPWLTWQIQKNKRLQPWVGLPNILLRDLAVPEYLQDEATPENLAAALQVWLDQPERTAELQNRFTALHQQLQCDTAQRATDVIEKVRAR